MEEFDVVVVGGGPGGSTAAALTSMRGHRVLVLERERFPRYQIGESLLPSTVQGICRLTGAWPAVAQAGFTKKQGGTFRWGANPEPWTFSFSISPKMAGQTSFAYQVERMKFDQLMLDNARRVGAEVRENCQVTGTVHVDGKIGGVRYTDETGTEHQVMARFVVDASGNGSRIYRDTGGERRYSEFFRSLALFGYFDGGRRLPEPNSGNILSVAFDSGWFWYIPLSDALTSVGVVVRRELAEKIQGDQEQALLRLIAECPLIADYLAGARRVTRGPYGQIRVRKDYSYHNSRFWSPGLVLVGDAACFVDPVFSSGVHLATYSALLAARSINSVLDEGIEEKVAFAEFEGRYRREYSLFYEFLMSFYDMHVSEQSYFWNARKITASNVSELQSFVELVAGITSGEAAFLNAEEMADRFKSDSARIAAAVGQVAGDPDGSMIPLLKAPLVSEAMRESAQVQAQAIFGVAAEEEESVLEGGLIASPDGLAWSVPGAGHEPGQVRPG